MSFDIKNNSITTSSGKITLEEGNKSIELRNGQIIITNKFVSAGTYVFPRNTPIPVCYIPLSSKGLVKYDISLGTTETNTTNSTVNAEYTELLVKILGDSQIEKTFTVSACQSNVTGSVLTTEIAYFQENKAFNMSAYNASNTAPTILCNNETVPYTLNSNFTVTQSGNILTFTNNLSNCVYASLIVNLL